MSAATAVLAPPQPPMTVPEPPLLTAAEFAERYADQHAELVKGRVEVLPMPFPKHGKNCATLTGLLFIHAQERDSGHVMSNDSWVQTGVNPDTVRGSDVCYFSYERLPKGDVPDGLLPVAPDLVAEVRSPSENWTKVFVKVGEYLGAGVRAVLVLDAETRTASVYRATELQQIFKEDDTLTLPDVLPGFAVRVARLLG